MTLPDPGIEGLKSVEDVIASTLRLPRSEEPTNDHPSSSTEQKTTCQTVIAAIHYFPASSRQNPPGMQSRSHGGTHVKVSGQNYNTSSFTFGHHPLRTASRPLDEGLRYRLNILEVNLATQPVPTTAELCFYPTFHTVV